MGARDDRETELGQLAYRAHNRVLGDRDATGHVSPTWESLPPNVRTAWEIAAAAVKRSVQRNGR
jgi:hypothetical protein